MNRAKYQYALAYLGMMLAFVVGLAVLSPSPLYAQQFFGSIVGTVTDTSGAIVPGATVTLTNKATAEKRTATSNSAGEYSFPDLVPATYSVAVERASFKRYVRDTVPVDVNTTVRVDAAMQVGAVTETVEVSTVGVQLQTDSGSVSNKVEAQQMDELPLNGRNVMQLLNITAGVISSSAVEQGATLAQNNGTSTNPLSWGGGSGVYTINGGDNEEYLDGAPINVLQGSNIGLMPTADAIQEFNIDTNVGDSSEGRATGGVINETTKSGTNNIHGTAYEYFRNADLNSNNFFNNRNGVGTPKFNQNLYGFNLGFPVKKDKIFFFGSYEVNNSITAAATLSNEPTAAMRNGVFNDSGIVTAGNTGSARPIYDPLGICSIVPYTGQAVNGTSFAPGGYYMANYGHAGLKPGTTCGDPTSAILQTFWAEAPNSTSATTNYAVNIPSGDVAPEMNARMDFNISPKQRVFAHTAWWAPLDKPLIYYPSPNIASALPGGKPWGGGAAVGGFNSNLYIVGDTYTFSPKTVLDVRAEYMRFRYSMIPKVNNFDLSQIGPNWAQFNAYLPSGIHWLPAPNLSAGGAVHSMMPQGVGFNNFGASGTTQIWDNYGLNGTITHVWGKHSVRAGFEARLMDMEILPSSFNAGAPNFGIKYSNIAPPATPGGQSTACPTTQCGDEWADFLMGYFTSTTFSGSYGGTEFNYYQAYFVSDTWQAARKLTLNLGLRWELPGGLLEKKNSTLVFQPFATDPYTLTKGTEVLVASPTSPSRSIFPIKHDLLDPRVGFAYRLDNKTVVRGGYGITTQAVDEDGGGNGTPGTAVNSDQLAWTNPNGGTSLPTAVVSNPIPNLASVYVPALRRSNPAFLEQLAQAAQLSGGTGLNGFWQNERLPYFQQYNFAVQRQIGNSFQITASYVGSHGVELKAPSGNIDQIPYSAFTVVNGTTQAPSSIGNQVVNQTAVAATGPYAGTSLTATYPGGGSVAGTTYANGVFCTPGVTSTPAYGSGSFTGFCNTNVKEGRTLQPYPNYSGAAIGNLAFANQHYNALQMTTQWRIPGGGLIGSAYTWAKTIGDNVGQQDYTNHRADRTVQGVPMRLVVNVNYPLPIGQGKQFLNGGGITSRIVSGWAINDITSFQHGGYLAIGNTSNNQLNQNFGAGATRASYVPGGYTIQTINGVKTQVNCNSQKTVSGSAVARLNQWFNTGCFQYPGDYTMGNEPANDPKLFGQGIDNFDLALLKTTKVTEKLGVQFRVETFNTFNRFQAGNPNTAVGSGTYGTVTTQANNPRQMQLSLRVTY